MYMAAYDGDEILVINEEPATPRRRWVARWRVGLWIAVSAVAAALSVMLYLGVRHSVRESRRATCAVHLKRLGAAMQKYHDLHEHFPAPSISGKDGAPLLSWRVALLPRMGYQSLYVRFHLDEPWDSPHNRTLLAEMPEEFACPAGPSRSKGQTGFLVIVGPITDPWSVNTPFEPSRGLDMRSFTDGTSNTILVFETDAFVPWTKPEDLRWEKDSPPPRLASSHPGGAHVLLADGATRFFKKTLSTEVLKNFVTINGGEMIGGG
jgi:Protein of unknown function (DUF1559)